MKLINPFKKQQKQNNFIEVKYSKLDHIGKVKRYEIPDKNEIDNQINNVGNQITDINNQITGINNQITNVNNKVNTNINDIANANNRINTNINNIATNVNNINSLNNKVNKITNDLSNANLAEYKGIWANNKIYKLGDLVSDNNTNNVYLSIINNNNNNLTDSNSWKVITFTIDSSNFATKQELANTDNKVNTNTTKISILENKVNNLPTTPQSQAIIKEFSNKQINFYKKIISTPNKMFWYELHNQNSSGYITISNLKQSKRYCGIVTLNGLNNKNIDWYVGSLYFTSNSHGSYDINFSLLSTYTNGYLSNQDFKQGGEGTFTANTHFTIILWELGN